jgi:PIN domain nuclease of toxin-antitoxin system
MRILLDTHAWLWFVLGDAALSPAARSLIEDPNNEKLVSPASYWEIAIKISMGKYVLPQPYLQFIDHAIQGQSFVVLPIQATHTALVCSLPFHHRDPFDRLLVAQALAEGIPLVSCDVGMEAYGVRRLW